MLNVTERLTQRRSDAKEAWNRRWTPINADCYDGSSVRRDSNRRGRGAGGGEGASSDGPEMPARLFQNATVYADYILAVDLGWTGKKFQMPCKVCSRALVDKASPPR